MFISAFETRVGDDERLESLQSRARPRDWRRSSGPVKETPPEMSKARGTLNIQLIKVFRISGCAIKWLF